MASATNNINKPFHTYENVCYDDQQQQQQQQQREQQHITNNIGSYAATATTPTTSTPAPSSLVSPQVISSQVSAITAAQSSSSTLPLLSSSSSSTLTTNASITSNGFAQTALAASTSLPSSGGGGGASTTTTAFAVNKTAIESPFPDPMLSGGSCGGVGTSNDAITPSAAKILSTSADSTGITTCMLSSATSTKSRSSARRLNASGQNLVTRLVTFPPQSPMDSLKEWSLSTLKCTKQLINEKRGLCPVTSDSQLANDIEQLRENRNKLVQMLRLGQQMISHYGQLVRTQKQLHALVNEMSVRCFASSSSIPTSSYTGNHNSAASSSSSSSSTYKGSKQVVANFSSLGNNLSSSTTTTQSPTRNHFHHHANNNHHHHHQHHYHANSSSNSPSSTIQHFEDYLPVLNHMKTFNDTNLVDDFKKNAITLNVAIRNGEKLIAALNFYCSNLSTLINKTIEDTLTTVKQFELARLEYDAEKNSLNFMSAAASSPSSQTSATYSSDKVELARLRYEQLREDVQIKMRFLEENTIKVMHKQLLLFNGAFASYTAGNTAALDSTLKQFSIRD